MSGRPGRTWMSLPFGLHIDLLQGCPAAYVKRQITSEIAMPDDLTLPTDTRPMGKKHVTWDDVERAALLAQKERRASGEIMTYFLDGWVVREHPGGRITRLGPVDGFRWEDFPDEP